MIYIENKISVLTRAKKAKSLGQRLSTIRKNLTFFHGEYTLLPKQRKGYCKHFLKQVSKNRRKHFN